jgi:hypothetical protein
MLMRRWCLSSRRWIMQAAALIETVLGLHSRHRCHAGQTVEVSLLGKALGAQMHFLALALSSAVSKGKGLIYHELEWVYAQHEDCPVRGRGCYMTSLFRPYGVCERRLRDAHAVRGWERELNATREQVGDVGSGIIGVSVIDSARHLRQGMLLPKAYRSMGLFWWRSTLLELLLRPSPFLSSLVRDAKAALPWPVEGGIIALHVRRGDSCLHAGVGCRVYGVGSRATPAMSASISTCAHPHTHTF